MFLTFELWKRTFSCCDGCRIYRQKHADRKKISFIMLCWGNSWNFFMLSTMSSCSICFKKSLLCGGLRTLIKKHCLWIYYITWLVKTQKSTPKCSFVKIIVLRLTKREWGTSWCFTYDNSLVEEADLMILDRGSKRTNHKFGCFGEVRQSNILIPSTFYLKMCISYYYYFFFQKVGGRWPPAPPPARALHSGEEKTVRELA